MAAAYTLTQSSLLSTNEIDLIVIVILTEHVVGSFSSAQSAVVRSSR